MVVDPALVGVTTYSNLVADHDHKIDASTRVLNIVGEDLEDLARSTLPPADTNINKCGRPQDVEIMNMNFRCGAVAKAIGMLSSRPGEVTIAEVLCTASKIYDFITLGKV